MQVSLNWLSTHIDLSGYTTAQLSDLLTFAGIEVEGIEQRGVASEQVVVGQIKELVQHPNADRLSVCQVDDGSGALRQIVCTSYVLLHAFRHSLAGCLSSGCGAACDPVADPKKASQG
jgi:hypothetical protein